MKSLRRAVGLGLVLSAVMGALGYAGVRVSASETGQENPLKSLRRTLGEPPLRARVEQRVSAGSYTYLALRTDQRALQWTVMLGSGPPIGTSVVVRSMGHKSDFHSRRLARTFPDLMFGIVSCVD